MEKRDHALELAKAPLADRPNIILVYGGERLAAQTTILEAMEQLGSVCSSMTVNVLYECASSYWLN